MIDVLFFGPVAERVGASRIGVEFRSGLTLQDLRDDLQRQYPEAFALVAMTAVNGERTSELKTLLADQTEVVFMSKFSGG
jgi:molybdopterin synthase sulfur carrier subunit